MSVADRLGLPEAVQTALLIVGIALALTPWLAGFTIGSVQIPKLDPRRRRALRVTGPLAVLLGIALVVPVAALRPEGTDLRILAADLTANGEIDVAVTNAGTSSALLTGIELELIRERRVAARPVLRTTATYRLPIDDLGAGERRRLVVRHLVPAGATERIVIAPETTRAASIRLSLHASDGAVITSIIQDEQP